MNIFIRAYVERIKKGDMTIEQVPEVVRDEVEAPLHFLQRNPYFPCRAFSPRPMHLPFLSGFLSARRWAIGRTTVARWVFRNSHP